MKVEETFICTSVGEYQIKNYIFQNKIRGAKSAAYNVVELFESVQYIKY